MILNLGSFWKQIWTLKLVKGSGNNKNPDLFSLFPHQLELTAAVPAAEEFIKKKL